MSFAATAAIIGSVTALTSIGLTVSGALTPSAPKMPDLEASSKELSDAEAWSLPMRRYLEAAAQNGLVVKLPDGDPVQVTQMLKDGKWVDLTPQQAILFAKAPWLATSVGDKIRTITRPPPMRTIDFTGLGSADIQSKIAKEMARLQLNLSKKYDPQFIDEALKQQKLADPESFAARARMSQLIQQQIADKPERPVAELLDKQVGDQLAAAKEGHLQTTMRGVLDDAVGKALAARGGHAASTDDFEAPLVTGAEGEARKREAVQKAQSWLSSGNTPEDVEYRREQQNLANLSAEINGKTPVTEFDSLSGAQHGPTPFVPGNTLPQLPANNTPGATNAALNSWNTQMNAANNQVNPWMTGLTSMLSIGNLLGAAGWKPLAANPTSTRG